jgi:hypothetical protein
MLAMMPTLSGVVNDPNGERTGTYLKVPNVMRISRWLKGGTK